MVPMLTLLLLLSSTTSISAQAADELNYIVVKTSSFEPKTVCKGLTLSPSANLTSWVPLSRPHGPCLPGNTAAAPSVEDMLRWDQYRADDIQRKLSGNAPSDDQKLPSANCDVSQVDQSGVIAAGLPNKGSTMSIERPDATGRMPGVITQTMVLDTASDVPWVQCVPCPIPQCHPQTDVVYDPSRSGTYAPFPCNSPTCRQLGPYANGCTSSGQCQYRVRYPDGSSTTGTLISDTLTLTPNDQVRNFQFGCSHAEQGKFSNKTAGIMALGGGTQSLVSQAKGTYGHVFSYCIPTPSSGGFFTLGVPRIKATRFVLTPMIRNRFVPTFYLVRLQAITVAGQRLNVPPTVFAAGSVMDSRTIITRLPPTAYQALRSAFRDKMRMYRMAAPKAQLDTCYDFRGTRSITLPRIALVFDRNAVVELDPAGILLGGCLAFSSNTNDLLPGIIGNVQQQKLEVLYNVGGGVMGFRRGCRMYSGCRPIVFGAAKYYTVPGQRLNVPPTVFAAGSVMDSRTIITRLPPTAYQALRSAFRDKMRMYRMAAPKAQLDTCYDFRGTRSITVPRIALVFDRNAVVELDPAGILLGGCLAFSSNTNDLLPGIIGNVQQQKLEVLYNFGGGVMGFRRGAC